MAKQITADEESILKRQARRRLIGAVALTTAVVIILPIVFDGEPPATKVNEIELRIPDKDKIGALPPAVAMSAVSVASAVTPASAPAPVSAPVAASATLPVAVVAAIVAVPVVAAVAAQHSQVVKAEQPKAEVAKPIQQERKVEAKPKPAVSHHAVPHSGFVVQVGAFSNLDAAKKLQDKLASEGLHVYTEKIGHNVRVRVGSFPTREAADKVRHTLETQGLHPNVVNLNK
jgi:DedD protein